MNRTSDQTGTSFARKRECLCTFGLISMMIALMASGPTHAQTSGPSVSNTPAGARLQRPAMPDDATCLIEPSRDLQVGIPVDGVLEQLLVGRGEAVATGQVLARLNTAVETAAVDTQAAKAEFGQRKLERNRELQARQLISAQEADELKTEQMLAELELRERQERLRLRVITSPINGVVVDVYRQAGDLVRQEKILRLMQLDPLYVETVIPARQFGQFRIGQPYTVVTELGSQRLQAKVDAVDRVIDPASGTFRVRLSLPNPRLDIPPGQRCTLRH